MNNTKLQTLFKSFYGDDHEKIQITDNLAGSV